MGIDHLQLLRDISPEFADLAERRELVVHEYHRYAHFDNALAVLHGRKFNLSVIRDRSYVEVQIAKKKGRLPFEPKWHDIRPILGIQIKEWADITEFVLSNTGEVKEIVEALDSQWDTLKV